jgi:hypothetical protein
MCKVVNKLAAGAERIRREAQYRRHHPRIKNPVLRELMRSATHKFAAYTELRQLSENCDHPLHQDIVVALKYAQSFWATGTDEGDSA